MKIGVILDSFVGEVKAEIDPRNREVWSSTSEDKDYVRETKSYEHTHTHKRKGNSGTSLTREQGY
jgi:hypothetical protein